MRQGAYGICASFGGSASLLFVPVEPIQARRDAEQEQEGDRECDQASAEEDDQGDDVRVVLLIARPVENAGGVFCEELCRLPEAIEPSLSREHVGGRSVLPLWPLAYECDLRCEEAV